MDGNVEGGGLQGGAGAIPGYREQRTGTKEMKRYILILILAQAAALFGCSDFDQFYKQHRSKPAAITTITTGENGASPVVARLGSREITLKEILDSLKDRQPRTRFLYLSSPAKLNQYINSYLNEEILYDEALRRGVDRRPDVKKVLDEQKKRLLVRALSRELVPLNFPDKKLKAYFNANSDQYRRLRASAVVVKIDPTNSITRQKALERANRAYEAALRGEDFKTLVARYSNDERTKSKGGDLGFIEKGRFPPAIEKVLFSMRYGEVSKPLEIPNGYVVAKISRKARVEPYERVRKRVEYDLRRDMFVRYLEGLKRESGVRVYGEKLKEIVGKNAKRKN